MNIRKAELVARLAAIGAQSGEIALAPGIDLVVTGFGGRVFGPFIDGIDPAGWFSPAFAANGRLADFARSGEWNIGGERLWLSPELDFLVGDRSRFWETFSIPAAIDPGMHWLDQSAAGIGIEQKVDLSNAGGTAISVRRNIEALPVGALPQMDGIRVAGYRQSIDIASADPSRPAVPWIVRQVGPGGSVIVPVDAGSEATAMLGEPPAEIMQENAGAIRMDIVADRMFKIAMPARVSTGVIGHVYPLGSETLLQVFRFSHDRQGVYHDEPPDRPGVNGFSSFLFQDDGALGAYGEIEMVGIDPGPGPDGRRHAHLVVDTVVALGDAVSIDRLATGMLTVPVRA